MAENYDFMLAADRNEKAARFRAKQRAWKKARSRGIVQFILVSELRFGVLMALGWIPGYLMFGHVHLGIQQIAGFAIYCTLLGGAFSAWEWYSNERRFSRDHEQASVTKK